MCCKSKNRENEFLFMISAGFLVVPTKIFLVGPTYRYCRERLIEWKPGILPAATL